MYRVVQRDNKSWAIVDRGDVALFVGTMRQCEDWLDHQQNLQRLANRVSLWKRLGRWLKRSCSGTSSAVPEYDSHRRANRSETTDTGTVESSSEVESSPAA